MFCASHQLLPSLNQVALIPRNGRCTTMVQWQGFKALMERNPQVIDITPVIVFKQDQFSVQEDGSVRHIYNPLGEDREVLDDLSNILGGYVKITLKPNVRHGDVRVKYHFVTVKSIIKARACAQTKQVWNRWAGPMVLKTILRDAYNRRAVPIDPMYQDKIGLAIEADDDAMGNTPGGPQEAPEQAPTLSELTRTLVSEMASGGPQEAPESPQADLEPDYSRSPKRIKTVLTVLSSLLSETSEPGQLESVTRRIVEEYGLAGDSEDEAWAMMHARMEELSGREEA